MAYEYFLRFAEPAAPSTYYYIAASNSRSTSTTDTPASTYVPGGLTRINFSTMLFDGIEPTPSPRGGIGAIVIKDPRGDLDYLVEKVWDGATLDVYRGTPGAPFSTFTAVANLTTSGFLYDYNKKEIRLRDLGWIFEKAELHGERYGGTGTTDGDTNLQGIIKPYAVGQVFNISPTIINATNLVYQASCTPIQSVDAVRDGGVALALDADYASYALLIAAAGVTAGKYGTCIALGLIRLGATPVYSITADIKGDKTGGTYVNTRGDIAKRIVTRAGQAITAGQVNSTALSTLNSDQAAACGFFWNEAITKAEALNEVMVGCAGWWFFDLTGSLHLGALGSPALSAEDFILSYPVDFGVGVPSMMENYQAPRLTTNISYQRNYTIQGVSQLSTSATAASISLYGQPESWRQGDFSPTGWSTAQNVYIRGGFVATADARAEAIRQQNNMSGTAFSRLRRERWKVPTNLDPYLAASYLGKITSIPDLPRFNFSSSQKFFVAGVEFGSGNTVILHLWC